MLKRQIIPITMLFLSSVAVQACTSNVTERHEAASPNHKLTEAELRKLHYPVKQSIHTSDGVKNNKLNQSPTTGVKTQEGWLVGSDRGEFGGELVFISKAGNIETLFEGNIKDIYSIDNSLIVIAGSSQLLTDKGSIYRVIESPAGVYFEILHILEAAPSESRLKNNGEILIKTDTSTYLLSPKGSLRKASCNADQH